MIAIDNYEYITNIIPKMNYKLKICKENCSGAISLNE